jgi:carboxypeptidase C (cathepsin A)
MTHTPLAIIALLLLSHAAAAQDPNAAPTTLPSAKPTSITKTLTVGDKTYTYDAKTDFIFLRDDAGKPQARFFHTSYTLTDPKTPPRDRPITFVFNGGPGSSSVWLHLGAVGPRRIVMNDNALPPPGPGQLADNLDSWLPASDLVFIDPIGTGFSRAEPGVDPQRFYSVDGDVTSIGEFIRLYLARNNRWSSPKFLAGESYGTTRAAALSFHLSRRLGIDLSGIILVSAVLEFSTLRDEEGNDLPYTVFLPSYTAVAHHHKKLPPDLQSQPLEAALKRAESFALGEYALALMQGANLPPEKSAAVASELATLTGLPADYISRNNLRIPPHRFFKQLLGDRRLLIGRFDGTITGFDQDPGNSRGEFDPSYTAYFGAYTSALNHYLRDELTHESELRYDILAGLPWQYPQGTYVNVATQLSDAMIQTPSMRVMVASGHHDLATPYFATRYTLSRLNISPELRKNIALHEYFGGHMMYHYPAALKQLGLDARAFISAKP